MCDDITQAEASRNHNVLASNTTVCKDVFSAKTRFSNGEPTQKATIKKAFLIWTMFADGLAAKETKKYGHFSAQTKMCEGVFADNTVICLIFK